MGVHTLQTTVTRDYEVFMLEGECNQGADCHGDERYLPLYERGILGLELNLVVEDFSGNERSLGTQLASSKSFHVLVFLTHT